MVYEIWDLVYKIVQHKYKIMIYFSFTKSVLGGGGRWHVPENLRKFCRKFRVKFWTKLLIEIWSSKFRKLVEVKKRWYISYKQYENFENLYLVLKNFKIKIFPGTYEDMNIYRSYRRWKQIRIDCYMKLIIYPLLNNFHWLRFT